MLPKLTDTTQNISFSEGDGVSSSEILSTNVVVSTTAGNHNHGSSKVKLKSLVDYNWECKQYPGQLLAIHMSGKYLAYSIKAPNTVSPGTWSGMVRVVYKPEPGADKRALIKGMKGEVQDVSFAHIESQVILASVDEQGSVFIHLNEVTDTGLRVSLLAEVREDTGLAAAAHRVVWCPYIPDEDDADDADGVARLLLTTHGDTARMWNTASLAAGSRGSARALLDAGAGAAASRHAGDIVAAAFSPDGTALATAGADGLVMFLQVYMHNEASPRCLHKWQPHAGQPLSCLFFLDNYKNYTAEVQFWKFAVTGAENNTVLKIWSCKLWTCLQTLSFAPAPGCDPSPVGLKAMLDSSANYLVLSDAAGRALYVVRVRRAPDDAAAAATAVAQLLLPYPVLSFCIVDAGEQSPKCASSCGDVFRNGSAGAGDSPDDFDDPPPDAEAGAAVRLQLYIVQPKGLQEGELTFSVAPAPPADTLQRAVSELSLGAEAEGPSSILQQQSQQLKSLLMRTQTQPGALLAARAQSPAEQLNLMTPDAFSSPGKRDSEDPPLSSTPDVALRAAAAAAAAAGAGAAAGGGAGAADAEPLVKLTSGGSSPSREVQEIMALTEPAFYKELSTDEASQSPAAAEAAYEPDEFDAAPPATKDDWPQISLAQISEANRKVSSDKSGGSLSASLPPPDADERGRERERERERERDRERGLTAEDRARLDSLEQKIDKLTELVSAQSRSLRQALPQQLDAALRQHSAASAAAVQRALAEGAERTAARGEAAAAAAAAAAQAAGAGAARALEPLAAALQHELAAKLTTTDRLLRENVEKLANSKSLAEKLSASIAASLTDVVQQAVRAALGAGVLPALGRAHQAAFAQLQQAFVQGTQQFIQHTEAAAGAAAARGADAAVAQLRAALDAHAAAARAPTPQVLGQVQRTVREVLEKELAWWRGQRGAELSRAHTPAADVSAADRQLQISQIEQLIARGDANAAFQLALSASELALVVAACRAADPAAVFAPPCRLKQHVLLSLVQQLAHDMARDTQLKHRYLEEAIMNLDTSSAVVREHLPAVVRELQKQVLSFLSSAPAHPLARSFKMLLMAAESLVAAV